MAKSVSIPSGQIYKFWAKTLIELGKTQSYDLDLNKREANDLEVVKRIQPFCFACGLHGELHRAHILARQEGGSDTVENLHLLCPKCHIESEYMKGELYWHWLKTKDMNKAYTDRNDLQIMKATFIEKKIREMGLPTENISIEKVREYISMFS